MTIREAVATYAQTGPFTISDVANDLNLNPHSVSAIVTEMASKGVLVRVGTKKQTRGRPLTVYDTAEADKNLRAAVARFRGYNYTQGVDFVGSQRMEVSYPPAFWAKVKSFFTGGK